MFCKKTNVTRLLVLVVIFLASCTEKTTTEPELNNLLQPLEIGNFWSYSFNNVNDTLTYTVVEELEVEVDGKLQKVKRLAMANLNYYYFNNEEGLHYIKNYDSVTQEDSLADYSVILAKYPVELFETWYQDFDNDGISSDDNLVKCISLDTFVNTPAGDFNCIVLEISNPDNTENVTKKYYTPGIGLVRSVHFDNYNNTFQEKILCDLHVE